MTDVSEGISLRTILKRATAVLFVTGLLALFSGALYLRLNGPPRSVSEPFDVQSFASIYVPTETNAVVLFRQAAPKFTDQHAFVAGRRSTESANFYDNYDASLADWTRANKDVRDWLELNRPAMELWKEGSQANDALDVPPRELTIASDSGLTMKTRSFARLAVLEASRLKSAGRLMAAWEWYRAALRTSRLIAMHTGSTPRLVGAGVYSMAAEAITPWSATSELTAQDLRRALRDVLAIEKMTPPTSDFLKAEYLAVWNSTDWAQSQLGSVGTVFQLFGASEKARRSLNLIFANWLSQASLPRFKRTPIHAGKLPLYELESLPTTIPNPPSPDEIQAACGMLARFRPDGMLLGFILPNSMIVIDALDREQARRAALILTLALQLYDREHGDLPDDLQALVKAGYLPSIPPDPFGKGEAFHYRRNDNRAEGGLLWSVWTDGVDQQGKVCVDQNRPDSTGDECFPIRLPSAGNHHANKADSRAVQP
jgi:hypothetical protein